MFFSSKKGELTGVSTGLTGWSKNLDRTGNLTGWSTRRVPVDPIGFHLGATAPVAPSFWLRTWLRPEKKLRVL